MKKPYRISQTDLKYIYESAQARMKYNPKRSAKAKSIVNKHSHFSTEKEALEFAIEQMTKNEKAFYQIWAKIEKGEDEIYRIINWWLSTDEIEVLESAEYIGLAQLYDWSKILSIIDESIPIAEVIAYY